MTPVQNCKCLHPRQQHLHDNDLRARTCAVPLTELTHAGGFQGGGGFRDRGDFRGGRSGGRDGAYILLVCRACLSYLMMTSWTVGLGLRTEMWTDGLCHLNARGHHSTFQLWVSL